MTLCKPRDCTRLNSSILLDSVKTTYNVFAGYNIIHSCLTFSRLSCTKGTKRGLTKQNSRETRLIPAMEFNCTGTLVGLTVSGRNGSGTMYPKLQIWRRSSTNVNLYFKNGPEIQIDAQGSACESLTRNVNCSQEFYCRLSEANHVSIFAGSDIIGVELPPFNNQLFELLFVGNEQLQHVWRQEVTSSNLMIGTQDIIVQDDLFLNVEVLQDPDECLTSVNDCDQVCTNTTESFQCSCINGYTLSSNEKSCLDIDECTAGTHDCQQHCINVNGGFLCECNSGYQLNSDGTTCSSTSESAVSSGVIITVILIAIGITATLALPIIIVCVFGVGNRKKAANQRNTNPVGKHTTCKKAANQSDRGGTLNCSGSSNETIRHGVVVRGSLKAKITPSLHISSTNLQISDPIGQGEFGIVYKGYFVGQFTSEIVAIKTLKGFIDKDAIQELLRESAKMKSFNHPHVMNLKGVCLDGGPVPYIILPYMANGSLLSYLQKKQSDLVVAPGTEMPQSQVEVIEKRLLDMCFQVAKGMEYLACQKVVHRDLAARNCMIDMNMIIKVSDFGLSVSTGEKEYYRLSEDMGIKLPFRWMAPETFLDYIFSEKTDVWSYGITCWEIFTGGQVPYAGIRPTSLKTILQRGERLETPNNSACSGEMYSIMQWCWEMDPDERPSFSTLVESISKTLEDKADYLDIGAFSDHYDGSSGQAEAT